MSPIFYKKSFVLWLLTTVALGCSSDDEPEFGGTKKTKEGAGGSGAEASTTSSSSDTGGSEGTTATSASPHLGFEKSPEACVACVEDNTNSTCKYELTKCQPGTECHEWISCAVDCDTNSNCLKDECGAIPDQARNYIECLCCHSTCAPSSGYPTLDDLQECGMYCNAMFPVGDICPNPEY